MPYIYSDPTRETKTYSLPNIEVFEASYAECPECGDLLMSPDCSMGACHNCHDLIVALESVGWFWQACFPGCLPDGDPIGPFETEADAIADAQDNSDMGED